jgi:hypothetical protein
MTTTFEVHAHIWRKDLMWYIGIVDVAGHTQSLTPPGEFGYTALSLLEPDMIIHCYWLGGMPSDEERDDCMDLIINQAMGYYEAKRRA